MANKTIDVDAAFATLPQIPETFEKHCMENIPEIPIFYKRREKYAECTCGKCGAGYGTEEIPQRGGRTTCKVCGHRGQWEWKRQTRKHRKRSDITLVQCTTDKNLVMRIFRISYEYQQDYEADVKMTEKRRYFLCMGDVYKFYNRPFYDYAKGTWEKHWGRESDHELIDIHNFYPGYNSAIKESNLKYCNPREIAETTFWHQSDYGTALIVYANNPAVEMFAKCGMNKIVTHLIEKEGKTKLINRRAKTFYGQLRIKDKKALKSLIAEKGDLGMLKVLQLEKKNKIQFTDEQRQFLKDRYKEYRGEEKLKFLLRYMTLQQLINRVKKYLKTEKYHRESEVLSEYKDYLEMRMELGYDMTNELYLYPKSLKEKHDLMVKECNEKKDKLHSTKMMQKYPKIAEQYEELCEKYGYTDENYVIRPARDAAEIVREGRELHHCVGRENYLSGHNKGKSFILLLRKKESLDEPYYTIEIHDKEIIQWYGIRDSKPDKEIIGPWLDEYMEFLKNRKKTDTSKLLIAAG